MSQATCHTSHKGAAQCQQYRSSWARSFWVAQHLCQQELCHAVSSVWLPCTASEAHFRSKWLSKSGRAAKDHDICLPSMRHWSGKPNAMRALAESIQTHLTGRPLAQLIVHRAWQRVRTLFRQSHNAADCGSRGLHWVQRTRSCVACAMRSLSRLPSMH